MVVDQSPGFDGLIVSEALVNSRDSKQPTTTTVDFDGLLRKPLLLHEDLKEGCGGQLWPAGMVLAKYLLRQPQDQTLRGKRILELGAGGGLVGLALAVAILTGNEDLDSPLDSETHIEITDQLPMLPLMRQNISLNNIPEDLVTAQILDWGHNLHARPPPDILLAADCVYFEPAFPLLLQTLKALLGPETVCYFCFKKRRRADMRFLKDAKKLFHIEDVLDDPDRAVWSKESLFLFKITKK